MNSVDLIKRISEPTFSQMLSRCPRKVREILYSKFGIKSQASGVTLQLGKKREDQVKKLHEKLKHHASKSEIEICSELIRNWLYLERPMLKATLDYLGVPNQEGLVDTELDFFKELSEEKSRALFEHMSKKFNPEHVWIYLNFVEVPFVPNLSSN